MLMKVEFLSGKGKGLDHTHSGCCWYSSVHAWLSCFNHVPLFVTSQTVACQAPLSMGFSRQEHWSGLPCPPPVYLPQLGIELVSVMPPQLAGRFFTAEPLGKPPDRTSLKLKCWLGQLLFCEYWAIVSHCLRDEFSFDWWAAGSSLLFSLQSLFDTLSNWWVWFLNLF